MFSCVLINDFNSYPKRFFMKQVLILCRFALMLSLPMLISCSKSYNSNSNPSTNTDFKTTLAQGTWAISSFTQKTEDKSSVFAGSVFTFASSGTLTASQNGTVTSGSWSYSPSSVGYYGGPATEASLTISLGTQSPFNRLTRTWNIEATSSSSFSLVNPEPNEDEHVKFVH